MSNRLPKGFSYIESRNLYRARVFVDGATYEVTAKTLKDCKVKYEELRDQIKSGMHIDNRNITLEKYWNDWLLEREGIVKESTLYADDKSWKYLKPILGKRKLSEITKADVLRLQKELKKTLAANTVNKVTNLLSKMLTSAMHNRIINYNPVSAVKKLEHTGKAAKESNHRALTVDEQKRFFAAAKGTYYYNLYCFLIYTGCRIGEAAALTWNDIDYKNNVIHIKRTVSRTSDSDYIISDTPKTKSSIRDIPLKDNVKKILQDQKEQNKGLRIVPFDQRIFTTQTGDIIQYTCVNTCIMAIIKKLDGFERFSVHALRVTFATRCIEQGMQPNTLKELMGHGSYRMTMDLYAHVLPDTKAAELEKIEIAI